MLGGEPSAAGARYAEDPSPTAINPGGVGDRGDPRRPGVRLVRISAGAPNEPVGDGTLKTRENGGDGDRSGASAQHDVPDVC
jgi:hypothetical protein